MGTKIDVADLTLGMYIEELDRPWLETPFTFQGFCLQKEEEIEEIRRHCRYVYIHNDASPLSYDELLSLPLATPPDAKPVTERQKELARFADEIKEAKQTRDKAKHLVDSVHEDIRTGKRVDTENAKGLVSEMMSSVTRNPDALVWLSHLKNRDEYTALHSLNVCTLSLVFGNHLGLNDSDLHELGLGALLHDIGKLRVPLEVLNKPDRLTDQEFSVMKRHPKNGVNLLGENKGLSKSVLDIVHSHHERYLGQGYPRGLQGNQISLLSMIVAIVDVYDAMTSDRVYRDGMSSAKALKIMHGLRGREFDADLLEQFIHCLGLFPSGSLVELTTGEVGLIIPSGDKQRQPVIMLILDKDKRKYYPLRILDLKLFALGAGRPEIVNVLPSGSYGINSIDYASEIASAAVTPNKS